jgi:hypothetical protein
LTDSPGANHFTDCPKRLGEWTPGFCLALPNPCLIKTVVAY